MNLQLFGADFPPFYGKKSIMQKIDEIAKIDVQINELFIKREQYVEDLKKQIEEENSSED